MINMRMIMSEDTIIHCQEPSSTMTVAEFINKMIDNQILQYDTLFNAAIEKSELDLALKVLTTRADALREWLKLAVSDSE